MPVLDATPQLWRDVRSTRHRGQPRRGKRQGVLEGAGGEVLDLHGAPLAYTARADFLNPHFLALPQAAPWREELLQLALVLD